MKRNAITRPWTQAELDWLAENQHLTRRQQASHLGRSQDAIKHKLLRGNGVIERVTQHNSWPDDEIAYLRDHYATMTASEIARHLNRSRNSIIGKAKRLGLCVPVPTEATTLTSGMIAPERVREVVTLRRIMAIGPARDCQWIHDDDSRCGKPSVDGKSYCADHYEIVYRPLTPEQIERFIATTIKRAYITRGRGGSRIIRRRK